MDEKETVKTLCEYNEPLTVTKLSKLQRFILKAALCNHWHRAEFLAAVAYQRHEEQLRICGGLIIPRWTEEDSLKIHRIVRNPDEPIGPLNDGWCRFSLESQARIRKYWLDYSIVDLYTHEVLQGYFGFDLPYTRDELEDFRKGIFTRLDRRQKFDVQKIGCRQYQSAAAATARACARLEKRGLVERYSGFTGTSFSSGVTLTETGIAIAERLVFSANGPTTPSTSLRAPGPGDGCAPLGG
jgi:hypothetical protein